MVFKGIRRFDIGFDKVFSHVEIVVVFLVVNALVFLVIARNPPERF